jgi:hypothetical protein
MNIPSIDKFIPFHPIGWDCPTSLGTLIHNDKELKEKGKIEKKKNRNLIL